MSKLKSCFVEKFTKAMRDTLFNNASYIESLEEQTIAENLNLPPLTKEEIQKISNKWKGVVTNLEMGYPGFRIFKHYFGFNEEYIPFCYFYPWMLRVVNPIHDSKVLSNKGMTYNYFPSIKQPELVARRINGCLLSANNVAISEEELLDTILRSKVDMIIKLSSGSSCGKNIYMMKAGISYSNAKGILNNYTGDYVIQNILRQSSYTSVFNPSSLNTMRISTLMINGKVSVSTAMIRFGNPGSIVDNLGSGGACVGIKDDGSFMDFGFTNSGMKIDSWNNIKFTGRYIPNYGNVKELACNAHLCIPTCGFAGWDIALDENDNPVLIECNLIYPGLFFEQLANGEPAFHNRFDEFIRIIIEAPKPSGNPS